MEDIELIDLRLEAWPKEFKTVTHSLVIKAVPYPLPHLAFVIYLLWDLHSITLGTITQPFHPLLF